MIPSSGMFRRARRAVARLLPAAAACRLAVDLLGGTPQDDAFFESRVRPVLVEHCGECHLGGKSKGGLRLDSRALVLAGGDSGPAAVPGDPDASRLVRAVRQGDPDLRMPPRSRLPADAVAVLGEWVRRGLPDPRPDVPPPTPAAGTAPSPDAARRHWAFQPVRRAEPPAVPGVPDPVDRFLLARLRREGLDFAAPADRRMWIRRVVLDLTGLPATEAEVAAFVSDPRPDARERWVDALLATPAYGERWGRWWLDVARYADTNGQDENKVLANAWRYRDWVVSSLNAGLPMDRFLVEQVAGDLLPGDDVDERTRLSRVAATGFLVLGPKLLAEQDKPKLVLDVIDEQVDTIGRAMLGLTLGCARCHDHKFDPVSQREYYALAGILRSTRTMENLAFVSKPNEREVATREELAAIAAHAAALAAAESRARAAGRDADAALSEAWAGLLVRALSGPADPSVPPALRDRIASVAGGTNTAAAAALRSVTGRPDAGAAVARWRAALSGDGPVPGWRGAGFGCRATNSMELPAPDAAGSDAWTLAAWVRPDAVETEGDTRRWLVSRGANEWEDGHLALVLEKDRVGAFANVGGGRERVVAVYGKPGVLKAREWRHLALVCDGKALRVFVDGKESASAPLPGPVRAGRGPFVLGRRADGYIGFRGRLDAVRVFARSLDADELGLLVRGEPVAGAAAARDFDDLSPGDAARLSDRVAAEALVDAGGLLEPPAGPARRGLMPEDTRRRLEALDAEVARLKASSPGPAAKALAVADDVVTNLPVLARGSHLNPGKEAVPRGFPSCAGPVPVAPPPADRSGRLELARWIVHPSNPLTARVLANRVWQAHFGEGLVRTPDNFGLRGEPPTHPELLDWLASELVRSGWDLKALHRRIVLTRAYGQTSACGEVASDPDNRLLHAYPRQRMEAEMLRDALLAAGGRLDRAVGGTLVAWKNDEYVPGDDEPFRLPRRTLYLPLVRDRGIDLLAAFDGANPTVAVARRGSTVVGPQALYLMNAPLVREAAAGVASRVLAPGPEDGRVGRLYGIVLARPPDAAEAARARAFLSDARLAALDEKQRWTALAQALLASNEFTHRE